MVCQLVNDDLYKRLDRPLSCYQTPSDCSNGGLATLKRTPIITHLIIFSHIICSFFNSIPLSNTPHSSFIPIIGGHYTADAVQHDGKWLRFNDAVVDIVPIELVLAERPYLLFYQRIR